MPFRTALLVLLTMATVGCGSTAPTSMPAADSIADSIAESEAQPGEAVVEESGAPLVEDVITLEPEASPEATSPPVLVDMNTVEDFRTRFEAGEGKTRLVLLLSPT